jgi:hypothetical protein
MKVKPKIICLTPIRNEAWILSRFLKSASLWADHIIIADQMSTDGSREIAKSFPKVILIDNNCKDFNEPERQQLLIKEARKIEGPRILITLDADEMFTPNIFTSAEWKTVLEADKGTVIQFQWANFCPGIRKMWFGSFFSWGFVDDNCSEHIGSKIHSARIPLPSSANTIVLNSIKVIHFQYTDWNRMISKHLWYQCYELVNNVNDPIRIFRRYHHMYENQNLQYISIPDEWTLEYNKLGIDITSVQCEDKLWWDYEVMSMFKSYGVTYFRRLNIWAPNWSAIADKWNFKEVNFTDPRSRLDKYILKYLMLTQSKKDTFLFVILDRIIGVFFK